MNNAAEIERVIENLGGLASTICVVNGSITSLDEVEAMGWVGFGIRARANMPLKLYKYFPNTFKNIDGEKVNYSKMALENNTVHLSSPMEFDDLYDSDVYMDFKEYEHYRLIEYCRRFGIEVNTKSAICCIRKALSQRIMKEICETGNLGNIVNIPPTTEMQRLSNEGLLLKIKIELSLGKDLETAISEAIKTEYDDYVNLLRNSFRIACFSTDPYSQLMWGGMYADCHKGFCVEYTINPINKNYDEIYQNLYPVIYSKSRSETAAIFAKSQDEVLTEDFGWALYFHGVLRKGIDWMYQKEWRLLLTNDMGRDSNYNIDFYPITKVFIGNRMPTEERIGIIEICNRRKIPYVGMEKNRATYEMIECSVN